MQITTSQFETYERDGVVLLRQAFDQQTVDCLKQGFEQNLIAPGPLSQIFNDEGEGRRFFYDTILWPRIKVFQHFAQQSPAAQMAAELMSSQQVRVINDVIFYRSHGTQTQSPFHQDSPYLCVSGSQVCSLWMPLVEVEAKSALAFVPGSHKTGIEYMRPKFGEQLDNQPASQNYHPLPDITSDPEKYGVVSWDMEPGDCVYFNGLTIHGGSGNLGKDRELIAFSINWAGDDTRVKIRQGGMEPDLSAICATYGLKEGDALNCDGFPLAWPKNEKTS